MARNLENQAIFFELDGVVLDSVRQLPDGSLPWYPGALDALARLDQRRFLLFVATNRLDIAFGELRERDFQRSSARFVADCQAQGIEITKIYTCPFHPKGKGKFKKDSVFRKPAPGIFKMAQQEYDLNLARCWMIGHTTVDILAASRAGMGTILVETGEGGRDGEFHVEAHFTEPDLRTAAVRINGFEHALRC